MKSSLAAILTFGLNYAVAAPETATDAGTVIKAVLLQDKINSKVSLTALTSDSSAVLGRSCSLSLDTGPFSTFPISFDVDENSAGNITIGSQSFAILAGPDPTSQVSCVRFDSEKDSMASCTFSIPSSVDLTPSPVYHEDLAECFTGHGVRVADFLELPSKVAPTRRDMDPAVSPNVHSAQGLLEKRQDDCTLWNYYTVKEGDGDPWQTPLHIQLSLNMHCRDGTCEVGRTDAESQTIGWSASGSAYGWISAGFAVESTVETGNAYTCAGKENEVICIWKEVGRTAYRVKNMGNNWCFGERQESDVYEMISPNANDVGSSFYCVRGACRGMGQRYESARFKGGPGAPCC